MDQIKGPHIFVAYSWDSLPHKGKVKKLVQRLRLDGIDVAYDGDLQLGERIPYFLEKSISNSDIVLFVCTPEYKKRADNRIAGVGFENGIITGELYETCNEKKFIPVLFSGSWETSLPTWAKGKLGIDLSSQSSYEHNYQKLLSYLQGETFSNETSKTSIDYWKATIPLADNQPKTVHFRDKIRNLLQRILDTTKISGLVIAAVIASIIFLFIQPFLVPLLPNISNFYSGIHSDKNAPFKSESIDNYISIRPYRKEGNSKFKDNAISEERNLDDFFSSLYPPDFDCSTSNGTMPKGTSPITITITKEMQTKLSFIQQSFIGCSKQWMDDTLGLPFSEKRVAINDKGPMRPSDDESSKTGEILVCAYNVSDIVIVQGYFDVFDSSCQAYFITLLKDVSNFNVAMPDVYSTLVSNKPLGKFAFSEIDEGLSFTYGYSSNGTARTFYGEAYYFASMGNYQNFFFAVLDYGMLYSLEDFIKFISIFQFYTGPVYEYLPLRDIIDGQRKKFYPNTYGISILEAELTMDLISNYTWFDSYSLRDRS